MIRNLTGWIGASAVRVGKLWVPGRHTETVLANYTKQTFCLTGHEQYPYAFRGSATAVRFAGKFFLLWCRHQTKEYAPNDVTIPIEGGKTLMSGSRLLFVNEDDSNTSEEFKDLHAMEFIPKNYQHVGRLSTTASQISPRFWRRDKAATWTSGQCSYQGSDQQRCRSKMADYAALIRPTYRHDGDSDILVSHNLVCRCYNLPHFNNHETSSVCKLCRSQHT